MTAQDIVLYVRSSVEELKKVKWPSQSQTTSGVVQVVVLSVVVALFLASVDYLLNFLLEFLLTT